MTDDVRLVRSQSAELRLAAQSLRNRNRETLQRSRALKLTSERRRRELVLPSPWSSLPWRLPAADLAQVLLALPGGTGED